MRLGQDTNCLISLQMHKVNMHTHEVAAVPVAAAIICSNCVFFCFSRFCECECERVFVCIFRYTVAICCSYRCYHGCAFLLPFLWIDHHHVNDMSTSERGQQQQQRQRLPFIEAVFVPIYINRWKCKHARQFVCTPHFHSCWNFRSLSLSLRPSACLASIFRSLAHTVFHLSK